MHIAQQGRLIKQASRRQHNFRLPAGRAFRDSLLHQSVDAFQLYTSDDCADIDGFIERRSHSERAHAQSQFSGQLFGDAFLYQQTRSRAAHLPLIQPDSVHQAFNGRVEIGVFKNNEWRFAAKFERKFFVGLRGGTPNRSTDLSGTGEGNFVHAGMLY